MNRGRLTPKPQGRVIFGAPNIQLAQLIAPVGAADQTTPSALVGCLGAPHTGIIFLPYQAAPWMAAVGA